MGDFESSCTSSQDKKSQISEDNLLLTPDVASPTSSNSGDEVSCTSWPPPITLINAKNYITLTEGATAQLTADELSTAVDQCKELVFESAECSEERKWLVRRLIELRYQLQEAVEKESNPEDVQEVPETRVVLGHHFELKYESGSTTTEVCDRCSCNIWSVVQAWYQCSDCQYKCHVKCILQTARVCPHLTVSEDKKFEEAICPEIGLDGQGYACAECKTHISYVFRKGVYCLAAPAISAIKECIISPKYMVDHEPRLCDYTGLYYCVLCHWNNKAVIPARVLHNWDFEPRPVSRAAYQLLRSAYNRPIIQINTSLIGFVEELGQMQKIRDDLMLMKQYLVQCKDALQKDLLWRLVKTKHYLMKDTHHYSMQDLIDLKNTTLLVKMKAIRDKLEKHIKEDCKICSGQGYVCELCGDKNVVYPFDSFAYSCPKCRWVYHKSCWVMRQSCQRCLRLERRRLEKDVPQEENENCDDVKYE